MTDPQGLLAVGLLGAGVATTMCGCVARAAAWQIESRYHWRALALSRNILAGGALIFAAGVGALNRGDQVMVAYSFQARFAPLVQNGTKRQTIRAPRKTRHARPGDLLTFLTGPRMSPTRIGTSTCTSAADVRISTERNTIEVTRTDGRSACWRQWRRPEDLDAFARADGFKNWPDMKGWFRATHGAEDFVGTLIKWGELQCE